MSKVLHGARVQLMVGDENGANVVGIFTSCSYGMSYSTQPIYVMGANAPVEILQTAQEAIRVTATGWKVLDNGPHVSAKLPRLQDILTSGYIVLKLWDRETNREIMTVTDVKVVGFDGGFHQSNPSDITVTFMGRLLSDETVANDERADATVLP